MTSRTPCSALCIAVSLGLFCSLAAPTCKPRSPARPPLTASLCDGQGRSATVAWLAASAPLAHTAIARAHAWLDKLALDPRDLDRNGVSGKRKLAELLGAYVDLFETAPAADRAAIRARLQTITASTSEPWYHDMDRVDDATFKRDSTSYLRIPFFMDRVGLDTTAYRKQIQHIHQRLNQDMPTRGYHQQMAFHNYYHHFGLKEPYRLVDATTVGVIPSRPSPYKLTQNEVYDLTHEVGARYEREDRPPEGVYVPADLAYLRWALDRLTVRCLMADNRDLVGELAISIAYVGFTDLAVFREAISALLQSQNPDGSWSAHKEAIAPSDVGHDVEMYLHTTAIAVHALALTLADPASI